MVIRVCGAAFGFVMGAMVASWFTGAWSTVAVASICAVIGYVGMAVLARQQERQLEV
jgi:hypothetical protein